MESTDHPILSGDCTLHLIQDNNGSITLLVGLENVGTAVVPISIPDATRVAGNLQKMIAVYRSKHPAILEKKG